MKPLLAAAFVALAVAAPAPARPLGRPCAARDLRASGMLQGATGTMDGTIRLRNVSRGRCGLGGQPIVRLVLGHVLPVRERAITPARAPVTSVAAGKSVELLLDWTNWCGAWPGAAGAFQTLTVRIRLTTGATLPARVRSGRPRCDHPKSPSILFVARFVAAR